MKMEANELRISNHLEHNGIMCKVLSIDDEWIQLDNDQLNTRIKDCNPIPLTEEWLAEKSGFIKVNGWDAMVVFIKDDVELEFDDGRFYNHCDTELKYVHQVQNYYYSSKLIELQINK